jgi:hypothetical protein
MRVMDGPSDGSPERSRNGEEMRHSWIAAIALTLVLGLLGAATAGAEAPTPSGEEATTPAVEEAPTTSGEEAPTPASEAALAPSGGEGASVLSIGECSTGDACVWPQTFFGGTVGKSNCTGGLHGFGGNLKLSGANNCTGSNKAVWFRNSGTTIRCLNAGESSSAFFSPVNELFVGAENSHC